MVLILVTFSLVGWLYLGQASVITSATLEIERIQQEIDLVHQRNIELALETAELESINRIEAGARELGFAPTNPASVRYMPVRNYPLTSTRTATAITHTPPQPTAPEWQVWLDELIILIAGKPG